jgi:hypothetical protein
MANIPKITLNNGVEMPQVGSVIPPFAGKFNCDLYRKELLG